MAKVLLIRPQQIHWKEEGKRVGAPIGLLSIAANLESNGHKVGFIDATIEGYEQERPVEGKDQILEYGLSDEELKNRIANFNPDFVGITSIHTYFWEQVKKVAKLVKQCNPDTKVIVGGHHVSGVVEWVLKNVKDIDVVVKGEAELAMLNLVNNPPRDRAIIEGGNVDLQRIPIPKFNLIDHIEKYTAKMSHFGEARGKNFITNTISRGCPSGCSFCTAGYYYGKKIRFYSDEQIENQINKICEVGFEEYVVQDDDILAFPKEKRKQYFQLLKNAIDDPNKSLKYWNLDGGLYYSKVTEEHIEQLKEYGCYRVFLPIEGINIDVMHGFDKYWNIKDSNEQRGKIFEVIKWLNDAGIQFYSAIMIGFPGETFEDIQSAVEFAKEIKDAGAVGVGFHWLHPYPYTVFYDKFYENNIPRNRKWDKYPEYYSFIRPVIPLKDIDLELIETYIDGNFKIINETNTLNNSSEYKRRCYVNS